MPTPKAMPTRVIPLRNGMDHVADKERAERRQNAAIGRWLDAGAPSITESKEYRQALNSVREGK